MNMDSQSKSGEYPPSAFYFKVVFSKFPDMDTSFQEVSGIKSEITVEEISDGGDVYLLPKPAKNPPLILKRGIADENSPLVKWCKEVFENEFNKPIRPMEVKLYLLDEEQTPIRGWSFANAFPVKWEIENFNSTKNKVALETIELCYKDLKRII